MIESDRARGNFARDVYTWAHMPIGAGEKLTSS